MANQKPLRARAQLPGFPPPPPEFFDTSGLVEEGREAQCGASGENSDATASDRHTAPRKEIDEYCDRLRSILLGLPRSRETTIALTKLDELEMWLARGGH